MNRDEACSLPNRFMSYMLTQRISWLMKTKTSEHVSDMFVPRWQSSKRNYKAACVEWCALTIPATLDAMAGEPPNLRLVWAT